MATGRVTGSALPSLYGEAQAIERALSRFGWIGDPDELLAQLGIERTRLRAIEHDDEVSAAIETRRAAVLATPWRIEHPDDDLRAFFTAAMAPHVADAAAAAWQAVLYGYSVFEIVYRAPDDPANETPGRVSLAQIIGCPFEWFRVLPGGALQWVEDMRAVDERRFVLTVHEGSVRKPRGEALLAKAYWPWFFRTHGWRMWAKFLEQASIPLVYGKTPGERQALVDVLRTVSSGPVFAVSDLDSIATLDVPGNSPNKFVEFEIACVRRIQRLILGQTLTSGTDGGSGNRALGEVHERVRDERRLADLRLVAGAMQRIVNRLAALNGIEPARFVFQEHEVGLQADRAARDRILVDSGILRFTRRYLEEKYGLEPDDFALPDERASSAGAAFAARRPDARKAEKRQFTAGQEAIEEEIERTLPKLVSPIARQAVLAAIRGARDAEDLYERLAVALADADDEAFRSLFERALFAAEVMGYAHARTEALEGAGAAR